MSKKQLFKIQGEDVRDIRLFENYPDRATVKSEDVLMAILKCLHRIEHRLNESEPL